MKKLVPIFAVVGAFVLSAIAYAADVEEKEDIKKTLRFLEPSAEKTVIVDNVFGSIKVVGYDGQEVQLTAHKVIEARSQKKLEEAKDEVWLDISEEDDLIELYVDGPFRCNDRRSVRWRGRKREGYKVTFDFELKVPKDAYVELKTVNDGEISVKGIEGGFKVDNVNGGVEMRDIGGSGRAYAVNGDVTVDFTSNPKDSCCFGSLNGEVKVYFNAPLSADFQLKTFNGEVYSDFPVTYLPHSPKATVKKEGKKVYKASKSMGVRAGSGGPEIELDGFNGDMYILSKSD